MNNEVGMKYLKDTSDDEIVIVRREKRKNYTVNFINQQMSTEGWDNIHRKIAEMIYNQAIEA